MFVHVGKTGGESAYVAMRRLCHDAPTPVCNVWPVHNRPVNGIKELLGKKVLITVRDPIARVISAFNFRHPIGGFPLEIGKRDWNKNEKQMYQCFDDVNELAHAVRSECPCGRIAQTALLSLNDPVGHVGRGYRYYLQFPPQQLANVTFMLLRLGHVARDLEHAARWVGVTFNLSHLPTIYTSWYPHRNRTFVNATGVAMLSETLRLEYDLLDQLERHAVRWPEAERQSHGEI